MAEIRPYMREFKDSAVEMVRTQGMSIPKAAGGLGIPPNTLRGWVEAAVGRRPAPRSQQRAGSAGDSALQQRVREIETEDSSTLSRCGQMSTCRRITPGVSEEE